MIGNAAGGRRLEIEADARAPRRSARAPCRPRASSALLAVTTCLPAASAALTEARGGARPRRRSARRTRRCRDRGRAPPDRRTSVAPDRLTPRSLRRSRAETPVKATGRPQRMASSLPCRSISRQSAVPTVPRPAIPMRRGAFMGKVFKGRPTNSPPFRPTAGFAARPAPQRCGGRISAPRRAARRCATSCRPFQGSGGDCARPGECVARSRPARCAHSRRRARRSRCRERPRCRPSR